VNFQEAESLRLGGVSRAGLLAVAGITLTLGLTACNQKTSAAPAPAPASPTQSLAASSSPSESEPTSAAGDYTPRGESSPGMAVSTFVMQILQGNYAKACRTSAIVAPPEAGDTAKMCADDGDAISSLKSLHDAWAKPGVDTNAGVAVIGADAQSDSVTVQDTDIMVGDKSLHDLELIGSSGDTSSFKLALTAKKKDDMWYVGGINMSA
jgi:hypothetical protein